MDGMAARLQNEGNVMEKVLDGLENIGTATLEGLDESQQALEQLQRECRTSANLLLTDMMRGAPAVAGTAQWIHDFITFEQEVVVLFNVDSSRIVAEFDSLHLAEQDMNELLGTFNEKMDHMDVVGIAELMRDAVPVLLVRFQKLLLSLRVHIHDLING